MEPWPQVWLQLWPKTKVKYKIIVMHTKETNIGMVHHKNKTFQAKGLKLTRFEAFTYT